MPSQLSAAAASSIFQFFHVYRARHSTPDAGAPLGAYGMEAIGAEFLSVRPSAVSVWPTFLTRCFQKKPSWLCVFVFKLLTFPSASNAFRLVARVRRAPVTGGGVLRVYEVVFKAQRRFHFRHIFDSAVVFRGRLFVGR